VFLNNNLRWWDIRRNNPERRVTGGGGQEATDGASVARKDVIWLRVCKLLMRPAYADSARSPELAATM
jgi:hypothetical protein